MKNTQATSHHLQQRVQTALVLVAGLWALFLLPPIWLKLVSAIVLMVAMQEWANLLNISTAKRLYGILLVFSIGLIGLSQYPNMALAMISGILWVVAIPLYLYKKPALSPTLYRLSALLIGLISLWGAWYGFTFLMLILPKALVFILITVVIADSSAYFAGKKYGKHALAPTISPNKTWEGVLAAFVGVSVWAVLAKFSGINSLSMRWVLACLILFLSIEGDLFESWLKRKAGVKDSGACLPGHGGVLDRLDGLIPVLACAPLLYFLIMSHH